MKHLLLLVVTFVVVTPLFAQVAPERKLIDLPKPIVPDEAVKSGLGGIVGVRVTVDNAGNVIGIQDVFGPGPVCSGVRRPDVLALREAAKAAALNAKFTPSDAPGTATLILDVAFPEIPTPPLPLNPGTDKDYSAVPEDDAKPEKAANKPDKSTIKGDRTTIGGVPPPDYAGPVTGGSPTTFRRNINGGVLNGKAIVLPKPHYPPAAHAVRASGSVIIQVLIDEEGYVFSARPVSGHPLLRRVSALAACGAQFSPTTLSGQPVKVSGLITYNFVP